MAVESWVGARLAATQRKISIHAFDRIDAVIWQFIADTIDPAEIQALLGAQALVLLRHKLRRERFCFCFFAAQQGQRERLATSSMMSSRRRVGIELGT